MILVDTSVLIDYLKGIDNQETKAIDKIIDRKIPFGICSYVYQEILQGSRDQKEFAKLKEYLETFSFYELKYGLQSFERAAQINLRCRKVGIAIRSTIDLLIAEIAIENGLYLLHRDNDYSNIAKNTKDLKLYNTKDFV
jgi:predicted nucleic acid-binding protein